MKTKKTVKKLKKAKALQHTKPLEVLVGRKDKW